MPLHTPIAENRREFYIVGIGASAGGLQALETLFQLMPENTGMAFVIVQHLSPDFKSMMNELLGRHTRMSIHKVEDGMEVEPDCLYLIPPNQEMIISNGRLLLTEKDRAQSLSLPIDHFLSSLARDAGAQSIALILSGTGSDGSRGICDIHEMGGLVVVQSPTEAKFDGMPKNAIDTGFVDATVEIDEIPGLLTRFSASPSRFALQDTPIDETSLSRVFRLLRDRNEMDFQFYKPATVLRRIDRRIQINHVAGVDEYLEILLEDVSEVDRLYKDLLIGVTSFFRDSDSFQQLAEDVIPPLLQRHKPGEDFRVWVSACGTGEEAYSIAILLDECIRTSDIQIDVKIFATDVNRASIEFAHNGLYSRSSLDAIDVTRRERYFTETDAGFQVRPEIRQMVVFAPHNLVSDAPFTRLDFVTCRNVLIYLEPAVQQRILALFHFGLRTGGVLFLGSSESLGKLSSEFSTLSERWKMFQKLRDGHLEIGVAKPLSNRTTNALPSTVGTSIANLHSAYDELLERFMPCGVLINEQREVLHIFGDAGKFLSLTSGRTSGSLRIVEIVNQNVKLAITSGLQQVMRNGDVVTQDGLRIQTSDGEKLVRLEISQLKNRGQTTNFLLTFEELGAADNLTDSASLEFDDISRSRVAGLEQELMHARENLQETIEELETSNEELQSTNEELVASNEELQSTNEELQSVNEELYTVNAEYQNKIASLTELTNDVNNLLVSTEVHTLFLDEQLCIRKFTPKMAEVFNLLPNDIGRRIDSFAHSIDSENLNQKLSDVLQLGERCEERVQDQSGQHFLMRLLPYRVIDETKGVVVTLVDIANLAETQRRLQDEIKHRDNFVAMLSHELRNPIGAVLNAIEVMNLARKANEVITAEPHVIIERQTRHMARLIDDLLDVARFAQNKIEMRLEIIDLGQIFDDVTEAVAHHFAGRSQAFESRLHKGSLNIEGDPARIKQAQINLLVNASKFTPENQSISYSLEKDDNEAVITVADSGAGIDGAFLGRVFDYFIQGETTLARTSGGMGVGLSLTRSIVESHNGTISAISDGVGKGSTFQIRLPLSRLEPTIEPSPRRDIAQGGRIMLVEDNADARKMLAKILSLEGFDIRECCSGMEAIEAVDEFQPQVAIVDIGLPLMSGYELAEKLRKTESFSGGVLIALTGYGQDADQKRAIAAGFNAHLVKPLQPDKLFKELARLVSWSAR